MFKRRTKTTQGRPVLRVALLAFVVGLVLVAPVSANVYLEGKAVNNMPAEIFGPAEADRMAEDLARGIDTEVPAASGTDAQEIELMLPSNDSGAWEREIRIREGYREQLQGRGQTMRKAVPYNYVPNPKVILLIGDSYSTGYAHEINSELFVRRLEQKLNAASNGGYKVVLLASEQSSLMRQADWVTPELLRELKPAAVVMSYSVGRMEPTWMEEENCKQFNTCVVDGQRRPMEDALAHSLDKSNAKWQIMLCLRADKSPVSTLFRRVLYPYLPNLAEWLAVRYCTLDRIKAGFDVPTERTGFEGDFRKHPHWNDFVNSLKRVRGTVDQVATPSSPIKTFVYSNLWSPWQMFEDTEYNGEQFYTQLKPLAEQYRSNGFEIIPQPISLDVVASNRVWESGNVQGTSKDTKANGCVYDCVLSDEQWAKNMQFYTTGLLASPMKYRQGRVIQEAMANDLANFIIREVPALGDMYLAQPLVTDFVPSLLVPRAITSNKAVFSFDEKNMELARNIGYDWDGDGRWTAAQCASVNHPNMVLGMNDNSMASGGRLRVSYHDGQYDRVNVQFMIQDELNNVVPFKAVSLAKGSYYDFTEVKGLRSVIVADPTKTCQDMDVSLNPVMVSVELFRGAQDIKK